MERKGRILIVDDNPKNLQVLANILSNNSYEVEVGKNSVDVFNWLDDDFFDILLLDVLMPGMTGFEVCKKLRQNKKLDIMPIIFISAQTDPESMVEGFNAGGQDYVSKPFEQAELLARIKTHIELKRSKEELTLLNTNLEKTISQRTKELQIANQRLIELSLTKDRFLTFLSKVLTSPLYSVSKVVDVIKQSSESSKMSEMIMLLDQSINKLNQIVQMATFITQMISPNDIYEKRKFSLLSVIDFTLLELQDDLYKKNLDVVLDIDKNISIIGNNELFKSSLKAIFSVIIKVIEKDQQIKFRSFEKDNHYKFIIQSTILDWLSIDNNLQEELNLFVDYSQTIMSLDGGSFELIVGDEHHHLFQWIF
nr:response regulator [uncultured Carboxylicivirga sp.]